MRNYTEAKIAKDKIDDLHQQLNNIRKEKVDIIEQQLRRLRIEEESVLREIQYTIRHHNLITKAKSENNRDRITDSRGEVIDIGDTVKFLTKGGYHSTEGVVVRFTRNFVIAEDSNRNEIRRKTKNVLVISKAE